MSVCVSLSLSLSLSLPLSLSLSLSLSLYLSLSIYIYLYIYIPLSLSECVCVCECVCVQPRNTTNSRARKLMQQMRRRKALVLTTRNCALHWIPCSWKAALLCMNRKLFVSALQVSWLKGKLVMGGERLTARAGCASFEKRCGAMYSYKLEVCFSL